MPNVADSQRSVRHRRLSSGWWDIRFTIPRRLSSDDDDDADPYDLVIATKANVSQCCFCCTTHGATERQPERS